MTFFERLDAIKVEINRGMEQGDYERFYGMLDYNGKTVIDIGAEYGTTAEFFLSKGASRVICYEANPYLLKGLQNRFGNDSAVEIHGAWDGEMPAGDILKMDCEGCEYLLKESQLQQFSQWAIGIHGTRLTPEKQEMARMLERNGGRVAANMAFEVLYVKL